MASLDLHMHLTKLHFLRSFSMFKRESEASKATTPVSKLSEDIYGTNFLYEICEEIGYFGPYLIIS